MAKESNLPACLLLIKEVLLICCQIVNTPKESVLIMVKSATPLFLGNCLLISKLSCGKGLDKCKKALRFAPLSGEGTFPKPKSVADIARRTKDQFVFSND